MEIRGYGKDIIMQGIARIFGGLLSFLAVFLLTYLFNEETLGKYNLVLTTVNVITSITTLWLSQSILRYYKDKNHIGSLLIMTFVCAFVSVILLWFYIFFTRTEPSIWPYVYVIVLVFYNILDAIFRKGRRLSYYVGLELLLSLGRLFPMIIIAKATNNYNSIFLSQVITVSLFLVVLIIREKNTILTTSYSVEKNELIQFFKFGLPLVGLSVSNWLLTSSDRYIIKIFGNDADVGIYSTNYSLGNSIYMMFALILVNAMHPIIINLWEKDTKEAVQTVSKTLDLYYLLMIPLVFYGCLKSNVLLGLFKGESYSLHSSVFIWTVLGIFIYGIALILHKYYECIQKTSIILIINLIVALFNIIANFILIPIMGFEVAAFTTFLSYLLYAVIVRAKTHNCFPIKTNRVNLIKVLFSVVVFGMIDHFLINGDSLLVFVVEGLLYIIYTVIYYQLSGLYSFNNTFVKLIGKTGK